MDELIDLVDESGGTIGQKPRKAVDKTTDVYHAVYVLIITRDKKLVLSSIPVREDLPNLYAHTLGMTVATIRRHDETRDEAAARALAREVYAEQSQPSHVDDILAVLSDGRRTFASVYYLMRDVPMRYNKKDIVGLTVMTADELDTQIAESDLIAPTLRFVWRKYRKVLPV